MILRTEIIEEFHKNGQMFFTETRAFIAPLFIAQYSPYGIRGSQTDTPWIRIGKQIKFHDNGQKAWELVYSEKGDVIKSNEPSNWYPDGTPIRW